jgi:YD repeat-containing protein
VTNHSVYDRLNRRIAIDLEDNGSLDIQVVYDAASRRMSMTDGTGTTTCTWDNSDRVSGQ